MGSGPPASAGVCIFLLLCDPGSSLNLSVPGLPQMGGDPLLVALVRKKGVVRPLHLARGCVLLSRGSKAAVLPQMVFHLVLTESREIEETRSITQRQEEES